LWGILKIYAFSLLFLAWATCSHAIVYVDKDRPGGNGTSWTQAYKTLDDAIDNTFSGQEFWIAEGTYTPAAPLTYTVNHTFYGGFAGNETARSQRNVTLHPTIIDGQNVLKHVFNSTSFVTTTRFDGLTIKRGNANAGSGADASGGGIVVNKGAVVIANCTFTDNKATHLGGAAYLVNNPSISITNSTFRNNTVLTNTGGGAGVAMTWNQVGPTPTATVDNCTFQGNTGGGVGGGLYSLYFPMTVKKSRFVANSSANGGAIMYDYKLPGAEKIERCLFTGNTATERGGAICSYARSVEVENSVFAYNSTTLSGGAVGLHSGLGIAADYNSSYSGIFRNCTFYANNADGYGGGIQNIGGHPVYIYNSIFWDNTATSYWQDLADRASNDIANHDSSIGVSPTTMRYTDMETLGWANPPAYINQVGSFSADPLLVDPNGADNTPGTADDDLSINTTSPCTDRADGNNAPATDFAFRARYDNPAVVNQGTGTPNYGDIGAYEGPYTPPVVIPPPVVPDGTSVPPYLSLLLNKLIFFEDFEGDWLPYGWNITDLAGNGLNWVRNDMAGASNRCQYGSGYSAAADSDRLDSSGIGMFTILYSPPINLFVPQAYLGYASNFQDFAGAGRIWLQIRTYDFDSATWSPWTSIRTQTTDDPAGGTWEVEDLSAYVGQTIMLRWVYDDESTWAWYWHIDTITVMKEPPPAPVP